MSNLCLSFQSSVKSIVSVCLSPISAWRRRQQYDCGQQKNIIKHFKCSSKNIFLSIFTALSCCFICNYIFTSLNFHIPVHNSTQAMHCSTVQVSHLICKIHFNKTLKIFKIQVTLKLMLFLLYLLQVNTLTIDNHNSPNQKNLNHHFTEPGSKDRQTTLLLQLTTQLFRAHLCLVLIICLFESPPGHSEEGKSDIHSI